jgi:oxygen-independent coproporphyrinogen-3 oxidase
MLGRGYDGRLARESCQCLLQAGFATVDVDLIFAIPTQTKEEVEADIEYASELGIGQISAYPLIPFSYAPLWRHLRQAKVTMPGWWMEQEMLKAVVKKASGAGYRRTSIWSFNKPGAKRYTSVTRDSFVGIGAGASSRMGDYFTLNTFSVGAYIKAMEKGSPLVLATKLDASDKIAYWLFWRCYDLAIDTGDFHFIFGRDLPYHIRGLLSLLRLLGLAHQKGNTTCLTEAGAYLFHLIEKEYTHAYLETLWQARLQEAWPPRVII